MADAPVLVLDLPEPPTLNTMLELARKKTRRGPAGVWLRVPQSRYWVAQQEYQVTTRAVLARAMLGGGRGYDPRRRPAYPPLPWPRWRIVAAHYRLHQLRDPLELPAGLKWAVDALVQAALLADDGPDYLAPPPAPTQEVARRDRGVTLTIAPGWPDGPDRPR